MKKTGCVLLVGLCAALLTACGFGGSSASDVGSLPAVESNVQQVTEDKISLQFAETGGVPFEVIYRFEQQTFCRRINMARS